MQYFAEGSQSEEQTEIVLSGEENHHLVRVKRIAIGDQIKFFNGKGLKGVGEIVATSKQQTTVRVLSVIQEKMVLNPITLMIATPKGKALSFLIEKAVEVGVNRIVPILSERSENSFVDKKADKLEKIVLEACKQCEQSYLPEISQAVEFKNSFDLSEKPSLRLLFHTSGGQSPVNAIKTLEQNQAVEMWIGPEGGWSDREILLAQEKCLSICTLPLPIMRVETAVIVSIGLVRVLIDKGL